MTVNDNDHIQKLYSTIVEGNQAKFVNYLTKVKCLGPLTATLYFYSTTIQRHILLFLLNYFY